MNIDIEQKALGVRVLALKGSDIFVYLTAPVSVPEWQGDFKCEYKIVGIGSEKVRHAMGIDGIQSLLLALKMIGTDLYTSQEYKDGNLTWEGGMVPGDLGFPVPDIIADILPK